MANTIVFISTVKAHDFKKENGPKNNKTKSPGPDSATVIFERKHKITSLMVDRKSIMFNVLKGN